jgi:phosphocarrier protein HPr
MRMQEVTVINPSGMHARACARIVHIASRFRCEISLVAKGRRVSARSILAVLLLSASIGTVIRLEADGPEEANALNEIAKLFHDGFGERA